MTAPLERPAGRPACGARPAGAQENRTNPPAAELRRLVGVGVRPEVAAVLALPRLRSDDERAYWRQISYGRPTTAAQRAAHAAAQRARRQVTASYPDTTRRSA